MEIILRVEWDEVEILRILNLLARRNARWLRQNAAAPMLYDSGIIYRPEAVETFRDVPGVLQAGEEDCDSLAAWRAGELLARGGAALEPGDPGWRAARNARTIRAEVLLTTRAPEGVRGAMYHAITRYQVGGRRWYEDDPSAKLGMRGGKIAPSVVERWGRMGIVDMVVERWAAQGVPLKLEAA